MAPHGLILIRLIHHFPIYHVRAIAKDIYDTIWIGTTAGLTKWDGDDYWFTYTVANSNLHSNNITDIYIDDFNTKYIGTINGGLSTYNNGLINYYRTVKLRHQ